MSEEVNENNTDDNKTIFRVVKDKDNPFVMMDRRVLENPALSWKAKGLLAYLLSRPDNWKIIMGDLVKRSTDGEHSTRGALKELIEAKHVVRITERDEDQRFIGFVYEVYEKPFPENHKMGSEEPFCENPQVENPQVENHTLNNTNNNKTNNNLAARAAERGMTNPNTQNRTDAKVFGDPMDGILAAEKQAADPARRLSSRISEYPYDVQQTLSWFVEIYSLPVGSIPAKPAKGGKGGNYAEWINEIRAINNIIDGYGKKAILATVKPCEKLSISRPAAIMWCLPGEVGKLSQKAEKQSQKSAQPQSVDTPFSRALDRRLTPDNVNS